jgi:hypothetical protein
VFLLEYRLGILTVFIVSRFASCYIPVIGSRSPPALGNKKPPSAMAALWIAVKLFPELDFGLI